MKDSLDFEYFNKSVTAHGVLSLLGRFVDHTGILPKIASSRLFERGSNAGYSIKD